MMIHWMRRTLAQGGVPAAIGKLLLALGYFCIVYLPIGKYVHLTGGTRTVVLALALFGPMLLGVPVALSLGLMATPYVALVGDISFMTAAPISAQRCRPPPARSA